MDRTAGLLLTSVPAAAVVLTAAALLSATILPVAAPARAQSPEIRPSDADSLTIQDCVALARQHAPALLAARMDLTAAAYESTATARERGPDWAVTSDALIAPKGFYDPTVTDLGSYDLKLGFSWPLADAGKRSLARRRSGLDLLNARWQSIQTARDAGLRAGELAAELLRLQEIAAAQENSFEWTIRLGSLVRRTVASGVRSVADSTRIGLERDAAYATLESTLQERRTDELELNVLIGRDPVSRVVIAPPLPGTDRPPDAEDSLRVIASAERAPEVGLAEVTAARSDLDLREARLRNAATLDFDADAGLEGADLTRAVPPDLREQDPDATFGDRLRRDLGASASFHFRLPVLDKSAARHSLAKSETLRAARARVGVERGNQVRIALDLLSQWRFAHRRMVSAEASRARAEDALLRVKSLYAAGATSLLDLLDARRVAEEASERLAEARRDSRLAQLRVEDRR
jgi:outer membrane protein TolC